MMKKHLLLLFLLATVWRLLFVACWGPLAHPDTMAYENLAQNISAGKGYVDTRPYQVMDASLSRPPGYPLFLAGIHALFPNQGLMLILIQQLLGVLTVGFVYRIGERLMDEKTGFQAGLISVFHPWLAIYGNIVMTETLFLFLFILAIFFLGDAIRIKSPGKFFLAGAIFGLSVLVRPAFILLPLLLPIGLFLVFKKAGPALRYSVLFGASCSIMLLPWIIWNHAHKGYTGLTSFSGINLLTLVQPPASFYSENDPFQKTIRDCYENGTGEVPTLLPAEISRNLTFKQVTMPRIYLAVKSLRDQGYSLPDIDRRFSRIARSYILRHPFNYLRSAGKEMLKLWSGYPLEWLGGGFSKRLAQNRADGDHVVMTVKLFFRIGLALPLIFFTALGAWKIVRRAPALSTLLLIIASITLVCGFFAAADLRYRIPAEPFIMLIILFGTRKNLGGTTSRHGT
jgi:4-amino-4-deoxy-L-arabinose transferase-like glycosyltransferase